MGNRRREQKMTGERRMRNRSEKDRMIDGKDWRKVGEDEVGMNGKRIE